MDCKDFKKIFPYFVNQLTHGQNLDEDLEADWSDHLNTCRDCFTWFATEQLKMRGYDPKDFPCPHIGFHATHECDQHDGPFDCPHHVIVNVEGDWGIPIKDDTESIIRIDNCPWCGAELLTNWAVDENRDNLEDEVPPPKNQMN